MKVFSYVVDHDDGLEPNPFFGVCTLCRCKYSESLEKSRGKKGRKNIVELAEEGDWVIGTGGSGKRSAGNGKLIYAMRVDKRLKRKDFCNSPQFSRKQSEPPRMTMSERSNLLFSLGTSGISAKRPRAFQIGSGAIYRLDSGWKRKDEGSAIIFSLTKLSGLPIGSKGSLGEYTESRTAALTTRGK
jgi:hypothetical protein